jgi:hypothetical protein
MDDQKIPNIEVSIDSVHLVVQVPFWHYERGATISDSSEIEKVMENHGHFVTQVKAPSIS